MTTYIICNAAKIVHTNGFFSERKSEGMGMLHKIIFFVYYIRCKTSQTIEGFSISKTAAELIRLYKGF